MAKTFEGSGILATQAKVSLQTTGLGTQLFKIKDQYECLDQGFSNFFARRPHFIKEISMRPQDG